MSDPNDLTRPHVGDPVHYVSYGTPGGEYTAQCRAAIIAGVPGPDDLDSRDEDVPLDLAVLNPSGLFFNRCKHDPGLDLSGAIAKPTPHRGGTWHWAGQGGCTA